MWRLLKEEGAERQQPSRCQLYQEGRGQQALVRSVVVRVLLHPAITQIYRRSTGTPSEVVVEE